MGAKIGGVIAAAVVLVGSFLPWASVSGFGMTETVSGMETDSDGKFTLFAAIVMGLLFVLWKRGTVIAAAIVSLLVLALGAYDLFDIQQTFGGDEFGGLIEASPGIGLIMVTLGGLAGVVLGLIGQASITVHRLGLRDDAVRRRAGTRVGAERPVHPAPAGPVPAAGPVPQQAQPTQYIQPVQQQPAQYTQPQYAQPVQPVQQQPVQAQRPGPAGPAAAGSSSPPRLPRAGTRTPTARRGCATGTAPAGPSTRTTRAAAGPSVRGIDEPRRARPR